MSRPLRIEFEGAVYHITSRGNEKKEIFLEDDDRTLFLKILKEVKENFNWLYYAYCLMNNHYHLVVETPEGNLSRGMRYLNGTYTQLYNKRHSRTGHLLQGRYKSILIEKDSYLLEVCRYVVLNPVRAGLTASPEEWKWSSYRVTAGYESNPAYLTKEWILGQFSMNLTEARNRYIEFVKQGIEKKSIWQEVKGQIFLGGKSFMNKYGSLKQGREYIREIPRIQRYLERPSLEEIFSEEIRNNKREVKRCIIEAIKKYGYYQSDIARFLNLHCSTIGRIVKKEENNAKSKT
ncbi:MAG: transposase [Candidatus Omnitrophica bacterium]|nr:transposase [Candidatus Omnitrophota bacterium]MCM8777694.1 transposase [Candidatus Omnitrophota bacterium]